MSSYNNIHDIFDALRKTGVRRMKHVLASNHEQDFATFSDISRIVRKVESIESKLHIALRDSIKYIENNE